VYEVEVTRFVRATSTEVERALTPVALIEYEGSFRVLDFYETDDGTVVTATGGGMELAYTFEIESEEISYDQRRGPLARQTTTLTYGAENNGTRLRMRSIVATGTPPKALTDRVAAWKRRGELKRALAGLAATVE
jgi:hypothetical protein